MTATDPHSGITFSTTHPLGVALLEAIKSYDAKQREWVAELRQRGIKAAHPDDGWVKRDRNSVSFAYPDFNAGPKVDDLIALGDHEKYRLVRVTRVEPWRFFYDNQPDRIDYYFEGVS